MTTGDQIQPAGTGRQPIPMNAPPAQPLSIGVQPGTPNVIRATKVIISGPGTSSGLFVYSPTPGVNNLIYADVGANGHDPYGNTVIQGAGGYTNSGGVYQAAIIEGGPTSGSGIIWYVSSGDQTGTYTETFRLQSYQAAAGPIYGLNMSNVPIAAPPAAWSTVLAALDPVALNTPETWHNMPAMQNGWAIGGHATYRLTAQGDLQVSFKDLSPGTDTDGTAIWAAGSLPTPYQVANNHLVVCYTQQQRVSGATSESAGLEFEPDGSIQCVGIAAASTRVDLYATVPLV